MSWFKIVAGILITLGVMAALLLVVRDYGDPDPTMDAIERSLEIRLHQQLLTLIAKSDAAMTEFTTDGCSGGLSVGWNQFAARYPEFADLHGVLPPWQACCVNHDREYHVGSPGALSASESFDRRKQADLDLRSCVVETGVRRSAVLQEVYELTETQARDFYKAISELMYRAVRIGGVPCTDQPWRWGYGWPQCHEDS